MSRVVPIADHLVARVAELRLARRPVVPGRVAGVDGLAIELLAEAPVAVGDRLTLPARDGVPIGAEVVGFRDGVVRALALGPLDGVQAGGAARFRGPAALFPSDHWLGRVVDPAGQPMDGGAPPLAGAVARRLNAAPPAAGGRARLGPRLDLSVRALDAFTTCRVGQRLGLFAGSGVGKSSLMAMLARHARCDVVVVGLVGERGRELREFVEDDLGPKGLARSVVVVATGDQPPMVRRDGALAAMAVAEHFRDQGRSVLLLMDSVTRYAQALREIGLAAGEPPATRGYTPGVFAELPRLLERAGPGADGAGHITGLFTVLVEGDDHNEPVADSVRAILDGHVVLDRRIAEAGRFPAVDVLRSVSRTVPGCLSPSEREVALGARAVLARWQEVADLVRVGAWKPGADPETDRAVRLAPRIEDLLRQGRDEAADSAATFAALARLLDDAA